MPRKLTQEQFIEKAKIIHDDKYDYSKVNYINNKIKIKIICKKHGEFEQIAQSHLRGRGCSTCFGGVNKSLKQFIEQSKNIHKNKYNYSKVIYKNDFTKIIILCPTHGEFQQRPNAHLQGKGCGRCSNHKKDLKVFIIQANKKHNYRYNYIKSNYKNDSTKIIITCQYHGDFIQTPNDHLRGSGCPKCGIKSRVKIKTKSLFQFISDANKIHNNYYDYSLVDYNKCNSKIKIICKLHGEFEQIPSSHLQGKGCPKCVNKNETKTGEILIELHPNISLARQLSWGKIFNSKLNRRCDFYFEKDSQKYIVEYNGRQHYQPVQFGKMSLSIAKENFKKQQQRDQELKDLCAQHNINLIEIDGREYQGSKIKDYLKKELSEIL